MENQSILIALTGLTGSGKDTVKGGLLKKNPSIGRIITHTTRPIRKGEQSGVNHYFVTRPEFEQMIKEGQLIEWVDYVGNYYGTSKKEFEKILNGQDVLWQTDLTMAARNDELFRQSFDPETAEKLVKKTLRIFLDVDLPTVRARLIKRGTPAPAEFEKRLQKELKDLQKIGHKFTVKVPNEDGKLGETILQIEKLIQEHKTKLQNEQS